MKLTSKLIVVVVGLLLIIGLLMWLMGLFSVSKDAHPPCDQLPTVAEVSTALTSNQAFIEDIELLGEKIIVELGQPCMDDQEKGLVIVSYKKKSDRAAIVDYLSDSEGIGVPVHLVKR